MEGDGWCGWYFMPLNEEKQRNQRLQGDENLSGPGAGEVESEKWLERHNARFDWSMEIFTSPSPLLHHALIRRWIDSGCPSKLWERIVDQQWPGWHLMTCPYWWLICLEKSWQGEDYLTEGVTNVCRNQIQILAFGNWMKQKWWNKSLHSFIGIVTVDGYNQCPPKMSNLFLITAHMCIYCTVTVTERPSV